MSTRGWEGATARDVRDRRAVKKSSKYRNVKTVHDGIVFDSKREADRYVDLRVRQAAGEIRSLRCQARFPLYCPAPATGNYVGELREVAAYVADFVYEEHDHGYGGVTWSHVVEDVKGTRTAMYELKKKWLELQEGIVIREI